MLSLGQEDVLAQEVILLTGTVNTTGNEQEPIANAMVRVVKPVPNMEVLGYTQSNEKGAFQLELSPPVDKDLILVITAWGFEKQLIAIDSLPSLEGILILCPPKSFNMEEVLIEETIPVVQSVDTVSFNVSAYLDSTERNLEDIVKKLPGAEVTDAGRISFGGKEINRILVEGDDVSGSDYTIVSKNVSATSVRKVEFIYDYVDNELLAGFDMPEALIMNVTLDSLSRRIPSGNANLGVGNTDSHEAGVNLTFFSSAIKSINVGEYQTLGRELYVPSDEHIEALQIANPAHPTINGRASMTTFGHETIDIPVDLVPFRVNHTGWGQTRIHLKPTDSYRAYLEVGGGVGRASEQLTRQLFNQANFTIQERHLKILQEYTLSGTLKNYVRLGPSANLTTSSNWQLNRKNTQSDLDLQANTFDIQTADSTHIYSHSLAYLNRLNENNLLAITGSYTNRGGAQALNLQTALPYYSNTSFWGTNSQTVLQLLETRIKQYSAGLRLIRKSRIGSSNIGLRYGHQAERLNQTILRKSHLSTQIKLRSPLSQNWLLATDLQPGIYFLSLSSLQNPLKVRKYPHLHAALSLQKKTIYTGWDHRIGFDQILPTIQNTNQVAYLNGYRSAQVGERNLTFGYRTYITSLFSYTRNLNPLRAFTVTSEILFAQGVSPYQQTFNIDSLITETNWEAIPQPFQQFRITGSIHKYIHPIRTGIKISPSYEVYSYLNQLDDKDRKVNLHTVGLTSFLKIITDIKVNLSVNSHISQTTFYVNGNDNGLQIWNQKHKLILRYAPERSFRLVWRSEFLQLGQKNQTSNQYLFHEVEGNYRLSLQGKRSLDITFSILNLSNQTVYGIRSVDDVWIRNQEVQLRPRTFFLELFFNF